MRLTYDPAQNIAYIHRREEPAEVETIHLNDELKIDIAADGKVYGIELLNANQQLGATLTVEGGLVKSAQIQLRRAG